MRLFRPFGLALAALVLTATQALAAFQFGDAVRNAMADALETNIGTTATLTIFSGAVPASCGVADSGTVLAVINLPSDWLAAASSGSKTLLGTWSDSAANAAGTAGHFRIKTGGTTCAIQGTITATSGGGDIELQNTSIAVGQAITITAFTITQGGG